MLNTEVELLRSRDILAQVVDKLDLGRPYVEAGRAPNIANELAMRDLSAQLVSGTIRRTNLVHVSYLSQSPELAASVVQEITDAYLAAHLAVHSSPGTYELFKTQAAEAADELRQAEEALAALGRSDNLLNLDTAEEGCDRGHQQPHQSARRPGRRRSASNPPGPRWPTCSWPRCRSASRPSGATCPTSIRSSGCTRCWSSSTTSGPKR